MKRFVLVVLGAGLAVVSTAGLPRTAPVSTRVSGPVRSPIAQPDWFWPMGWAIAGS